MNYDEQIAIEKARENKVVKDNRLIQTVTRRKYELSIVEQKMIGFILSMIKPDAPNEPQQRIYEFDIRTFCKVCGIDYNNGGNYAYLKESLDKLAENSFWLDYGSGEMRFQWIVTPDIKKDSGKVEIEIPTKIMPFLYGLRKRFTAYELYQILALKSGYSIKLYELLLSYAFTKKHTFELEELKTLIQCPYKEYKNFRRFALEKAVKEINEHTNLFVTWEPIKKGKSVVQIEFKIKTKDTLDSYEAYRKTMAELNGVKHIDGQLNLFEFGVYDNE